MEILNAVECHGNDVVFLIGAVVAFLGMIGFHVIITLANDIKHIWLVFIIVAAVTIIGWATVLVGTFIKTEEYKYEIRVEEGTTFKEVTDKYDIVERRGDIWVVKERKDD